MTVVITQAAREVESISAMRVLVRRGVSVLTARRVVESAMAGTPAMIDLDAEIGSEMAGCGFTVEAVD